MSGGRRKRRESVGEALSRHVSECAAKHEVIASNTTWIRDRVSRIEWAIYGGGAAAMGLLAKLAFFH